MSYGANAYAQTAQQTASPRELEAQLLLRAASRLQQVADGELTADAEVLSALRYNRKLWTVLLSSATAADNPLPAAVKQNLANLGVFIMKHSLALEITPASERFGVLVNINRQMAAGLRGSGEPAPA
jgi:flagellar protein FlaF